MGERLHVPLALSIIIDGTLLLCECDQVPWQDRVACFAPVRRLSTRLLATLQQWYLAGRGGYCEVGVPTINAVTNGTFATATEVCAWFHG